MLKKDSISSPLSLLRKGEVMLDCEDQELEVRNDTSSSV